MTAPSPPSPNLPEEEPVASRLRRGLGPVVVFLAALLFMFEELVWNSLAAALAQLHRLRVVARAELWISGLPPYPAMALFLLPGIIILPFKLYGMWLIAGGHVVGGIATFFAAKLVATLFLARLLELCRPQLLRVAWFARFYGWVTGIRERLYDALYAMPAWVAVVRTIATIHRHLAAWRDEVRVFLHLSRGRATLFMVRLRAARRLVRRRYGRRRDQAREDSGPAAK